MSKDLSGEYLRAIAQHGNFSNAARSLFISQPYLSKFIKKLEDELGVDLINRNESPITLTYAGERYLAYMKEIENTYLNMKNEIEAISNMKKGRLKIGINPILGSHTLYNLLPKYISSYPGIEIDLVEETSIIIEQLLLQRKIDICLNMTPIFNQDITYEKLFDDNIVLVVPKGHKYFNTDSLNKIEHFPLDIQSLSGEKFILLKQGLGLRRVTDKFFHDHLIEPDIYLETSNTENAYRLANSGVGLTIIPELILRNNQLAESNLYTIGKPPLNYHVVVAYKKDEVLSSPALAFLNMAKANYKMGN